MSPAAQFPITEPRVQIGPFDDNRRCLRICRIKLLESSYEIVIEPGRDANFAIGQDGLEMGRQIVFQMQRSKTAREQNRKRLSICGRFLDVETEPPRVSL